jgi:hypothetical protein
MFENIEEYQEILKLKTALTGFVFYKYCSAIIADIITKQLGCP